MKPLGTSTELANLISSPPAAQSGTLVRRSDGKPAHEITTRAQGVWDRLIDWYGVSKMADFGDWPGPDLCKLIDGLRTRDAMGTFLANIRNNHPQWPPTFAQMEQIVRGIVVPTVDWNRLNEQLIAHVLRTRTLTPLQRAGKPPWTFAPRGVQIHADGNAPGFFVGRDEVT